jgi:cytochrome c-type biogenesis protein CcmH/NrfF
MDALALVVWTVTFPTVMFFCGALIVMLRMRRRRAAAVRWALQQAGRELEAIPPRSHIRVGAVPMLVGVALGGVIVLSTYLYVAYQSRPALLLGMGMLVLVAARLRRARGRALEADDAGEDRPSA